MHPLKVHNFYVSLPACNLYTRIHGYITKYIRSVCHISQCIFIQSVRYQLIIFPSEGDIEQKYIRMNVTGYSDFSFVMLEWHYHIFIVMFWDANQQFRYRIKICRLWKIFEENVYLSFFIWLTETHSNIHADLRKCNFNINWHFLYQLIAFFSGFDIIKANSS